MNKSIALIVCKTIRRIWPELAMTRTESIEAIKRMQDKINELHHSNKEWRDRAFAAENAIADITKHARDKAYECGLSWRGW